MASRPSRLRINLRQQLPRKCESRKFCYPTKDEALDGAERLMELGRVNPGCHIMPYQCSICGAWHVANQRIVFA